MNHHDLEHADPPFPELGEEVELFLETEAREGVLLYERDGELQKKPMAPWERGLKARVPVHASPFRYCFRLPQGYLGSHGLERTLPRYDRFFHLLAKPLPPEWALGAVFYQIFPDRFRQGRPELAPKEGAWLYGGRPIRKKAWHEPPGEDGAREFYGGDLFGVLEALPYLEALGVEALRPLEALAEAFRAKRLAAGALEIALPEVKVRVEGEEVRITPLPPYPSRVWVREAMLLAGYAAAHLAVREGLPFPFATQEAPARRVEGEGLAAMWEQRKALKRAQLKAVPAPHKGLGLPLYAQVTSPLRRYLDLVAHQQLRAWLKGERPLSQAEVLERVGAAEAVADLVREAERKSKLHWTLLHLEAKGYEGPGVLVERRGGQGVFLLPELGLSAQVALPKALPLNAEARLRFLEADLPALEARFALV